MTTDAIKAKGAGIAKNLEVAEYNVVENSKYLLAMYTDPSFLTGMILITFVVVLAGALTLYSIYYVSMIPKVQEYGQLKAIGASRRQIRQIVFREGILVACVFMPLGLLLSAAISRFVLSGLYSYAVDDIEFNKLIFRIIENGKVPVLRWWIFLLAAAAVLLTVYMALRKPMRTAAGISPVEAIRYGAETSSKRRIRKGYQELNLFRITKANLSRNRKRTVIKLQALANSAGGIRTDSYEKRLESWVSAVHMMSTACYTFMVILGGIGAMNLINTMINSIYTRKKELGMMQAVGMSERQLIRMLQMEGIFYTAGTLLLSVGFGSLAGYGVYLYAKSEGLMNITRYRYPLTECLILILVVGVLQLLLTYVVSGNFRKTSLIDRIRNAE